MHSQASFRNIGRHLSQWVLLGLVLALPIASAHAATTKKRSGSKTVQPRVAPSGSEEKPAQRDRRLLRECKGRPNAGACLGYTS